MIALCRQHHDFADAGGFSNDELRSLKTRDYSVDSVKANFTWAKMALLIRLGGCYSGGSSAVLRVSGDPVPTPQQAGRTRSWFIPLLTIAAIASVAVALFWMLPTLMKEMFLDREGVIRGMWNGFHPKAPDEIRKLVMQLLYADVTRRSKLER